MLATRLIKITQFRQGAVVYLLPVIMIAVLIGISSPVSCAVTIPTPGWMETAFVADKMIINGMPSEVYSFEAERKIEKVLDFYRQRWTVGPAGKPGYREATVEPWHVISRLEGRYLFTVQAQQKNGFSTSGFLAIADLQEIESKKDNDKDIPKMKNSRVINDMKSLDPGQEGRTSMIINNYSVTTNGEFYLDYYEGRGWGRLEDRTLEDARVLAFRNSGKQSHIVIRKTDGGSVIVMNQVTTD